MTEFNDGQNNNSDKWIGISEQGTFHTADQTVLGVRAYKSHEGITTEEVKETLGEVYGVDPDEITTEDPRVSGGRAGRNTARAAFRTWNSSWVPQGDKDRAAQQTPYDPTMN